MKPVSRARATCTVLIVVFCLGWACAQAGPPKKVGARAAGDPKKLFEAGEAALHEGRIEEAERDFQQVLAMDSKVAGAYANLGVIQMRRKQWAPALEMLDKAEGLAPKIPGIRLNIGLVYFRQNDFRSAIPPFESVVKEAPDSYQARYLLGLCYFFNDRWGDAIGAMEPLWGQASGQLNYLYVLGIAAYKAKNSALEEKALGRLVEIGENSPEFHLLMGKARLNREEYDEAVRELTAAAQGDPKLPFVHFNLGLAYAHKREFERARAEFQKNIEIEPDVAFAYEQLGSVEATLGNEDESAKNYRQALKLNGQSVSAHMGLAKIEEHRQHYALALAELDRVIRLDSGYASARYLRGQVLTRMGREKDGRAELAVAARMLNAQRAARQKELEGGGVPSPELAKEPE